MNATLARLTRLSDPPAADAALLEAFLASRTAGVGSGEPAGGSPDAEDAFATLVRRHAGLVYATCRRVLRHQQDAEDAFQATFLVLARRAADVWPREALGAWLFGVAHRVALKARAVRTRRAAREQALEDAAGAEPTGPECDLAEAVHRVVCRLPEVYRAAVVACDLEGLSRKEAAERLGWPEGTLSGRLARARELLATRFRRAGITLPAGGLTAVFASESASAATVQTTIDLATGAAGTASAPVAALCEGVVRSMGLVKLKMATAVVLVACSVGFGAFAPGAVGDQKPGAGGGAGQPPARPAAKAEPPAKPPIDRDRLQGTWRVVSLTEGGDTTATNPKDPWVIEVTGGTLAMPYREPDGWKQRKYEFALDDTKGFKTIDLIQANKPVARGIYEFTAPASRCADCHSTGNEPLAWALVGQKPPANLIGLCGPGLKTTDLGLRLALSIDGKRPNKFGDPGVIVFELRRPADKPPAPGTDPARAQLEALRAELERAAKDKLDKAALERLKARLEAAEDLFGEEKAADRRVAEAERALLEAARQVRGFEGSLEAARMNAAEAQRKAEFALANVELAKAHQKVMEKALAEAKKAAAAANAKPKPEPAPADAPTFTVHLRSLTAAENVTRVKLTGTQTVLDALAHTDGVALKPDAVSVWVVRDGAVLPVDLAGIVKGGETKTNYVLKAGDALFVQFKPAK